VVATPRLSDPRSAGGPAGVTSTGEIGTSDPFLQGFFARVPPEVARSFTPPQLDAIKLAFSAREWRQHAVDIRWTFGAGRWRSYLVLLMGRARRRADGRGPRLLAYLADAIGGAMERTRRAVVAMLVAGLLVVGLLVVAGLLYTGKRAMNINVVPGIDMLPDKEIERMLH
jgi:hypothetical protein